MADMQELPIAEITNLAKKYSEEGTPWHHHFITQNCIFNKESKFQIVLENEKTKEIFVCKFDSKPLKELEVLENIFFKR